MTAGVQIAHGARAVEAALLAEAERLLDEAREDPGLLAAPVRIVVPSRSLRIHLSQELVERARDAGAMAYVVKPFTAADLLPALEIAVSRHAQITALEAEVADLAERFATRKLVDRAKGLLQAKFGMTEPEAFRWIQKTSMDKRLTMREVASAVVEESGRWRVSQDPATFAQRPLDMSGLMAAARCPVVLAAGEGNPMATAAQLSVHTDRPRIAPGRGHNVQVEDPAWIAELIAEAAAAAPAGQPGQPGSGTAPDHHPS